MSILKTNSLTKKYGERTGIQNVSLEIQQGDLFGFLGPNGAGKSTTIRILLGLLKPTDGSATIFGCDAWSQSDRIKKEVGYLPGDVRLYQWMTARKALRLFGQIRGKNILEHGLKLAERFRLETNLRVHKMSKGTRQKLGLVLAMAHQPKLLILDEPTSGLDPLIQNELMMSLQEQTQIGNTVFFSSHSLSEVEQLCHRVAFIREGKIVVDDSVQSLIQNAPRQVRVWFGSSVNRHEITLPHCLNVSKQKQEHEHHGDSLLIEGELVGSSQELVQWVSRYEVRDLVIAPPNLEKLFHKYYEVPSSEQQQNQQQHEPKEVLL